MRILVVGYGSIGKRHAENIESLGHEVIVHDPPLGKFGEFLGPFDAIVHATPASERIINGSFKHYIEKPIAVHSADIPRDADAFVQVGYQLRFDRSLQAFKDSLSGFDVRWARVEFAQRLTEWRPGDYRVGPSAQKKLGGGILREASHELDLIRYLFGEWSSVTGEVRRLSDLDIDVEDSASAVVNTVDGAVIELSLNMMRHGYRRGVEAVNAKGETLVWKPIWDGEKSKNEMYLRSMAAFLKAVKTGVLDPRAATLDDGIAALKMVEALERASEAREVVFNGSEVEGSLPYSFWR